MRTADKTRQNILNVTADEIHKHGFKATSLATIICRCNISKGALYHHFDSKLSLGYAVFEEIYIPMIIATWQPALSAEDPIEGLCKFFTSMANNKSCDEIICGCPLNNLCQEMASVDEGFRLRILNMQQQLNQLFVKNFERVSEQLKQDINYSQVAYFIAATLNGTHNLSKSSLNIVLFQNVMNELCKYIRALKR